LFMQESRRRDEESRRREELERLRRDEENKRREDEREGREDERERREETSRARDERLFAALRENKPVALTHAPSSNMKLPHMKEGDELEQFIPIFEASLCMNNVPDDLWKTELTSHLTKLTSNLTKLTLKSFVKIEETLQQDENTYEVLVGALMGCTSMSFCSAAEDMCTSERGRLWELEIRQTVTKMKQLVKKVVCEAD